METAIDGLIKNFKVYYGEPKRPGIETNTRAYIQKYVSEKKYKVLFRSLMETHSATALNNPFPSVKEIKEAIEYARKEHGRDLDHKVEKEVYKEPEIPEEEQPTEEDLELLRNALSGKSNIQAEYEKE